MFFYRFRNLSFRRVAVFSLLLFLPIFIQAQEYGHAVGGLITLLLELFLIVVSIVILIVNLFKDNKYLHRACIAFTVFYFLVAMYLASELDKDEMGFRFLGLFVFGVAMLSIKVFREKLLKK